jgi:hypothetical protein
MAMIIRTIPINQPNAVVESLTLLFRIREVLGSKLGPETGYPEIPLGFHQGDRPDDGGSKDL